MLTLCQAYPTVAALPREVLCSPFQRSDNWYLQRIICSKIPGLEGRELRLVSEQAHKLTNILVFLKVWTYWIRVSRKDPKNLPCYWIPLGYTKPESLCPTPWGMPDWHWMKTSTETKNSPLPLTPSQPQSLGCTHGIIRSLVHVLCPLKRRPWLLPSVRCPTIIWWR